MQAIEAHDLDIENDPEDRIKVAVLDSGIDTIVGLDVAYCINFVQDEQDISPMFRDMSGHGTGVASIIAGTPQNAVQGVNPGVDLYSVKVLDAQNSAPLSRIIEGIFWCIDNEIDIINMSFGTPIRSMAFAAAVAEAYEAGILMVAAAGNDGGDVQYPAAFPEVLGVASVGVSAEISDFSAIGDEVEIAAPGESIRTLGWFGTVDLNEGTSVAVPHVVGAASVLWQQNRTKCADFIRGLLVNSTKEIECERLEREEINGIGLLDVEFALEIYDDFAEIFEASDGLDIDVSDLPENEGEPEIF